MSLLKRWRQYRLKREIKREAEAAAALCALHWTEYWATIQRVPFDGAADQAARLLPWHIENFSNPMRMLLLEEHPTVMLSETMFWLCLTNGINRGATVPSHELAQAIRRLTDEGKIPTG